jgi:hypothetical protein
MKAFPADESAKSRLLGNSASVQEMDDANKKLETRPESIYD